MKTQNLNDRFYLNLKHKERDHKMNLKKIGALLLSAAVFVCMFAVPSMALEKGAYTASVVTSYYNPDTGAVDDGGTANAALGEGMCRSATGQTGLVEYDGKNTWVTIRLLLQSDCKNVAFYTRSGYNSYSRVNYEVTGENASADSIDYRFRVSDAGVKIKATMYVTPMGRDVVWYLYINTGSLKKGSGDFEVGIDVSTPSVQAPSSGSTGKASAGTSKTQTSQSSSGTQVGGKSAGAQSSAPASSQQGAKASAGSQVQAAENPDGTQAADPADTNQDGDETTNPDDADNPADEDGTPADEGESADENDDGANDVQNNDRNDSSGSNKTADKNDGGSGSGGLIAAGVIIVIAVVGGGVFAFIRKRR